MNLTETCLNSTHQDHTLNKEHERNSNERRGSEIMLMIRATYLIAKRRAHAGVRRSRFVSQLARRKLRRRSAAVRGT